jgi:hypothetical protein
MADAAKTFAEMAAEHIAVERMVLQIAASKGDEAGISHLCRYFIESDADIDDPEVKDWIAAITARREATS